MNPFKGKRVLVTGACGTVGKELIHQLQANYELDELVGLDNNESELFYLENECSMNSNIRLCLADIRDRDKLCKIMVNIDIVFHTAAYKHILLCERFPFEAVQTNIIGVQNIIYAAIEAGVSRVIFTSSDKAVNPTSVMGTTKLMGERLISAANSNHINHSTIFTSTRFGNILGSRGSVIQVFDEQIKNGQSVTLTDSGMTRFIMSLEEAIRLLLDSSFLGKGGEVFVTKMSSIIIKDLAEVMIQELAGKYGHKPENIKIDEIGFRAGEKMYEELISHEEKRRTYEIDEYFIIHSAFKALGLSTNENSIDTRLSLIDNTYNSENQKPLLKEELAEFLRTNNFF